MHECGSVSMLQIELSGRKVKVRCPHCGKVLMELDEEAVYKKCRGCRNMVAVKT